MARRSARLLKQPTAPAKASATAKDDSWVTDSSPPPELPVLPELPELPDLPEPSMETPQKPTAQAQEPATKLSQVTTTPRRNKSSKVPLFATTSHTPKNRTPIKPASQEMHPAHHHASTAKVLDEARWLGFQALGAHTAPPKAAGTNQATPSKTPARASVHDSTRLDSSPDFQSRSKSPVSGLAKNSKQGDLSPTSRNLLKDVNVCGTPGRTRAIFGATEFSTKADVSPERKKAEAKGKMARFSDVHMAQFKKMDSIANHPSAFRADPSRFKPAVAQPVTNKLKRTQSKTDLTEPASKVPSTSLKRTQSKMDLTGSNLPRSQSTVRLVPGASDERPVTRNGPTDGNVAAKRVKRTQTDDAATTRPTSRDGQASAPFAAVPTPARKITSQTALPRLASRLMTPTKSSVARSQSVKATKSTSMIPTTNVFSPTNIAQSMRDGARESMRKANQNLQRVRSILRTPRHKYSHDPHQIAAGTHMSPPPMSNVEKALPPIPATAPVKKHVNFTSSTLERAGDEELGKSPSPMKFRAGSELPTGAVIYPTLQAVQYPELGQGDESPTASPSRRLTFGDTAAPQPRSFSFESGKAVNFGPASTGTIRMVRKSDASVSENKKRKLGTVRETSDKENDAPEKEEHRSAKKIKATPATPTKTPASASKLPRRTPGRGSAISKSRLAFLATPKRSQA